MTDCSNVEVREQLPDLVSGMLSREATGRVEEHVSNCADCAYELAILRTVYSARPKAGSIDVASIVAALPRPADVTRNRRNMGWQRWRVAAALATIVLGGVSWQFVRYGFLSPNAKPHGDSALQVASDSLGSKFDTSLLAINSDDARQVTVSFGGLGDYTDEELQQILDRLENWDGAPSTEPLTVASSPLLPPSDGGSR